MTANPQNHKTFKSRAVTTTEPRLLNNDPNITANETCSKCQSAGNQLNNDLISLHKNSS